MQERNSLFFKDDVEQEQYVRMMKKEYGIDWSWGVYKKDDDDGGMIGTTS